MMREEVSVLVSRPDVPGALFTEWPVIVVRKVERDDEGRPVRRWALSFLTGEWVEQAAFSPRPHGTVLELGTLRIVDEGT